MTDTEAYDLGKRALRAGFKWAPGCVAVSTRQKYTGSVYVCLDFDSEPMFVGQYPNADTVAHKGMVPDVRDPAVIGHMWAQLAERAGAYIEIRRSSDGAGWSIGPQDFTHCDFVGMESRDLSHALVAALEMTAA